MFDVLCFCCICNQLVGLVTLGPMFMAQQPLSAIVVKKLLVKPSKMAEQQEEVWQCLEDFLQECNEESTSIKSEGLGYKVMVVVVGELGV